MPAGLDTTPGEAPAFAGAIDLPSTLTAGAAAARFVGELAARTIVGARCDGCARVLVPAQDFCGRCGSPCSELLAMPHAGTITAFTETPQGLLATIRIDGADGDLVHRVLDAGYDELAVGQRVVPRWAEEPSRTVLDLAGFAPAGDDAPPAGEPQPLPAEPAAEPVTEQPYELHLRYRHAYGPYYGRLFDELASSRRILGSRCPSCDAVLVPPRERCDRCHVRTQEWVDVADTGVLQAFSVIHLSFVGQTREPPYVYAEIILDGASTRLIHTIGGVTPEEAIERLVPRETRVRAKWREGAPTGTLEDIECFEVIA